MNSRGIEQTYYQILEVSPGAPHHEVLAAYNRAKEAYSPESPALYTMFTKEEAVELRKLIEEAFLILGNQSKRKEYDQLLLSRARQGQADALPDFAPVPERYKPLGRAQENREQTPSAPQVGPSGAVPDGFAKSRLSVYEVKPDIENEITNQKNFDGAFLRKVRQYKNINIDQLSKETRISRSYLAALESDDFEALPAPVFLRGFVIQVARMLGLDENVAATSYMSRVNKEE